MARILEKEELMNYLYQYYVENYGERDTDEWFEQPAVNVIVFKRDGKYISLQSHILTGKVTEHIEE
jgi:hypothetical protein